MVFIFEAVLGKGKKVADEDARKLSEKFKNSSINLSCKELRDLGRYKPLPWVIYKTNDSPFMDIWKVAEDERGSNIYLKFFTQDPMASLNYITQEGFNVISAKYGRFGK